jgi:hypothetical protein
MTHAWTALISCALSCALTAPAFAQEGGPRDAITWIDGGKSEGVRVQSFTIKDIKFVDKGATVTKPSETVASVMLEKVQKNEKYRKGLDTKAWEELWDEAKKHAKTDPDLAQAGFIEAARILINTGGEENTGKAFQILQELQEAVPTSGYLGEAFRTRLDYYLSGATDSKNATLAAESYEKAAQTGGWPDHYVNEALFYKIMAKALVKSTPASLQAELRALADKASTTPIVAAKANAQIGHSLLGEKKFEDARKIFESLAEKSANLDRMTAASVTLGLGHVYFESADATKREPYKQALLTFLKVWAEGSDAGEENIAEALYFGAEAARKWGEKDAALMANRLENVLKREYPNSKWTKAVLAR